MEQRKIEYGFSYIRAIASIAIVVLHICASASILYGESISVIQNSITRSAANCMMWAVPCFVMVTGALLLDESREVSYSKIYKKYISRILAALVIFCMIYRIFDMIMDGESFGTGVIFNGIYEIVTGTSWSHMWYLYLLIGLYLLLPVYRKIAASCNDFDMKYLLGIYILFLSILPLTQMLQVKVGFYIHVATIYPFYFFCGHAIHKKIMQIDYRAALTLAALSTVIIVVLTNVRWKYGIESMEQWWSYSSILVIVQAVGIFSLMYQIKGNDAQLVKRVLMRVDECSFGIYLVHMIFVRWILRYRMVNPYESYPLIAFVVIVVLIFGVSYVVVRILKNIPWIRMIL